MDYNYNSNNMEKSSNETVNYCKDLLGLCFTSPDCNEDQYFHAFSFDKDILVNMIDNINIEERNFYSIKNIKLFEFRSLSIPVKYNFSFKSP